MPGGRDETGPGRLDVGEVMPPVEEIAALLALPGVAAADPQLGSLRNANTPDEFAALVP